MHGFQTQLSYFRDVLRPKSSESLAYSFQDHSSMPHMSISSFASVGITETNQPFHALAVQRCQYNHPKASQNSPAGGFLQSHSKRLSPTYSEKHMHKRSVLRRGIKWIENFETQLDIPEDRRKALEELLENETFCSQVARETNNEGGSGLEFSGMLFQPVPWSPATTKGMPAEFEKFHADPDYATINVPPNFLFKAQIFKPSRLCAIYKKKGAGG